VNSHSEVNGLLVTAWVLAGDAAGFIDPVWSSGVFIAAKTIRDDWAPNESSTQIGFPMNNDGAVYDVVVIGGALSGAATATLLLRNNPGLNLLILEKSAQFTRRVGEATVEVSAFFMGRVLGMTKYLNECHLVKQGLRFWFTNDDVKSLDDAGEVGGHYQVRLPSYQLDRATFDEEVLRRACLAGAKLLRPVSVTKVELNPGGEQAITFRHGDAIETVRARWIVDASGVAALLARKEGWWRQNTDHPTAAARSRNHGSLVKGLDSGRANLRLILGLSSNA
jgi:flavin-dependent dehydrogenase